MQEILSMAGRRLLGGGGDLRMRPPHQNHQQQQLKCPRCDSLNTKFCYYNNYNLSQPRHFCKNCRRYWTKGGVLRNVPVGGGCRKSKRSNKPKSTTTTTTNSPSSSSDPPALPSQPPEPEPNSNSHSSSESSTLTVAATEAMSPPTSNAASKLDNVRESKVFTNPSLESGGVFTDIGSCTGLVNSNNEPLGFGFGFGFANNSMVDATTSFRFVVSHPQGNDQVQAAPGGEQWHHQQQNHHEFGTASFLDHTVPLEFSSSLHHKTGFGSLDWQPGSDQGLFDLPNTIDQPYWSHDQDNPSLFHLP